MRYFPLLTLALLLPASCIHAAPPKPNSADLPAYLNALYASTDPDAKAIRQRIAAGPADLARERAAAEKEGIPTRFAQISQPLPPAYQNAAPLYVQLDALRDQQPLHVPLFLQSLNGHWAYTPEQIAVVQKEYDARQDVFTLLHEAADKPQCIFVHDYSKGFSGDYFKNFAGLREDAREITTESFLLADKGNYSEAVTDQERGFRIADHAASEQGIISYLVGAAIDAITVNGLQTILNKINLNKAGTSAALENRVAADLALLHSQPNDLSLRRDLSGEAALADAELSLLRHANPADVAAFFKDAPQYFDPAHSARLNPVNQTEWDMLVDAAQASYLHQMRQLVSAADLPRPARQAVFLQVDTATQIVTNNSAAANDPIQKVVATLLSDVGQMGGEFEQVQAAREVTMAGAAVLAVKAQTGVFPDTLPSQFVDPFTGKSLGYRHEGTAGFVIYSAGANGTDNGGKPGDARKTQVWFRYPLVTVPIPADMLR